MSKSVVDFSSPPDLLILNQRSVLVTGGKSINNASTCLDKRGGFKIRLTIIDWAR
jgi:hypothetical protein